MTLGEYWIDVEVVDLTTGQIGVTYTDETMLIVGDKFTLNKEDFIIKNTTGEILTCTFNPKFVVLSKKEAQSLGYGLAAFGCVFRQERGHHIIIRPQVDPGGCFKYELGGR